MGVHNVYGSASALEEALFPTSLLAMPLTEWGPQFIEVYLNLAWCISGSAMLKLIACPRLLGLFSLCTGCAL